MIRRSVLAFALFSLWLGVQAQQGGITPEVLSQIRSMQPNDAASKALRNAISNNDINKLSVNRDVAGKRDVYFSNRVKTKGITDQKSSGRCWMFTSMNVFRPVVIEKLNLSSFEFSNNFTFFYDQLEKANLFFEGVLETAKKPMDDKKVEWLFKNPIGDGGQWTGFVNITTKYGLVPKDVMPETNSSDNTSRMNSILSEVIRPGGLKLREMVANGKKSVELATEKNKLLATVYKILVLNLGEPPQSFSWRYQDANGKTSDFKTYTPLQFYNEMVGINLQDYVMLMNDPSREYNKVYEIEYDRHTWDGQNWRYLNLPIEQIKALAIASIKDSTAMYFSCDVGKQLSSTDGTLDLRNYDYQSLFGIQQTMTKKERIQSFASASSHAMMLTAVDLDKEGRPLKWMVENSWGSSYGYNGFLILTDMWFSEYMFRLVVNKRYLSAEQSKLLEQKSIVLPPWDPMFAPEE